MMLLHPLNFEEYLWARGEERLGELIASRTETRERFPLHERALDLYREYLLVGGMPDAVYAFIGEEAIGSSAAYEAARQKQTEIDQAYLADIAKHAPSHLVPRIIDVWRSIPGQLAHFYAKEFIPPPCSCRGPAGARVGERYRRASRMRVGYRLRQSARYPGGARGKARPWLRRSRSLALPREYLGKGGWKRSLAAPLSRHPD